MYDVVIKAHEKDYHKLLLVINSLHYLNPQPEGIYIVSADGFRPYGTNYDEKIITIRDSEVTPFIDRNRLNHRPNWNWVNLVSILQDFTKNDLYFDVQADNFFLRQINLFDEAGRPRIYRSTANPVNNHGHAPYFTFSKEVFDIDRMSTGYSYIIEFMMYDRRILREMCGIFKDTNELLEKIYSCVNNESYPADQEIFGNLLEKSYPSAYQFVDDVTVHLQGIDGSLKVSHEWLAEYIRQVKLYRPEVSACSHHTWI